MTTSRSYPHNLEMTVQHTPKVPIDALCLIESERFHTRDLVVLLNSLSDDQALLKDPVDQRLENLSSVGGGNSVIVAIVPHGILIVFQFASSQF